jgi:hypothetical protein
VVLAPFSLGFWSVGVADFPPNHFSPSGLGSQRGRFAFQGRNAHFGRHA